MEKRGRETKKAREGRVGEEKKSPPLLSYSEKREEHRRRGRGEDVEARERENITLSSLSFLSLFSYIEFYFIFQYKNHFNDFNPSPFPKNLKKSRKMSTSS